MRSRPKNAYDWICGLKTELIDGNTRRFELHVHSGKIIALCAKSIGTHVSLGLWLESEGHGESVLLAELGTCLIEECSEKEMRKNLLHLFSRLWIYAFLGVTHKDFEDLKIRGSKKNISKGKIEELLRLEIEPDTIEARVYEQAFGTLLYAVCYSRLIHSNKQDNGMEYRKAELKELAAEMLQKIGPEATESLMKSLVSMYTRILSEYEGERMDGLKISYSSSLNNSWTIRCYSQRLKNSMVAGDPRDYAMNHQLLQCILRLDNVVTIQGDCIKVELKIDHLHCKALQLNSCQELLKRERYFPAKIRLTMWPECSRNLGFYDLSLGESSSNPSAIVCKAQTKETGLQVQIGPGSTSFSFGFKNGCTTSSTQTRKSWHRERSYPELTQGRQEWTLYYNSNGKPVYNYQRCCKNCDQKALKAFKTLAEGVGPDRPFTEDGGIIFEGDMCGAPMTWWFRSNGNLEAKSLKWSVEVEIWLAYYPNEYCTEFMETRYQKFRELVELSLVPSVKDSPPKPTSVQLVQDIAPQPTSVKLVQDSPPQPNSVQLVQDTAPHPTKLQVPLNWVIVICILFYFYNCFFK